MPIQFTVLAIFKHIELCSQYPCDISAKYFHSYSRLHLENRDLILSKQQPVNGISPPGLGQHHSTFWWNEFVSYIFQIVIIIAHALWDYLLQFNSLSLRRPQAAIYDWVLLFKVNQFPCAFLQHTVDLFMCSFFTGCFSRFLLWDFCLVLFPCIPTAYGISVSFSFICQQPNTYSMFSASSTQQSSISQNYHDIAFCFIEFSDSFYVLDKVHSNFTWNCPLLHISSHTWLYLLMLFLVFILITLTILSLTQREGPMAYSVSGSTIIVLVP